LGMKNKKTSLSRGSAKCSVNAMTGRRGKDVKRT